MAKALLACGLIIGCGGAEPGESEEPPAVEVVWTYVESSPVNGFINAHAIAVDEDDAVFVVGEVSLDERLRPDDTDNRELLVRGLSAEGAPLWTPARVDARPDDADRAVAVAALGGGRGALVVGQFDASIRAYGRDGDASWEVSLSDGGDGSLEGEAIVALDDGTFVVAVGSPWLVKIDGEGQRLRDLPQDYGVPRSRSTAIAAAGHRVFAGGTYGAWDAPMIWIGAFTSTLDPIWIVDGRPGHLDAVAAIEEDVVIAEHADEGVTWDERYEVDLGGAARLSRRSGTDGSVLWERALDESRGQRIRALAARPGGDLIVVGEYSEPYLLAWIARLDGEGETLWSETVEIEEDGLSQARALAIAPSGRLYVAGLATDAVGYHRLWVQARG
ncbi:MAG: hypothetical protein KC420_17950 [Myxococcales bacterium]|nr:hypothetical protein [Myxococcales bacterium]